MDSHRINDLFSVTVLRDLERVLFLNLLVCLYLNAHLDEHVLRDLCISFLWVHIIHFLVT